MKEKIVVDHILNQLSLEMRAWIARQQQSESHELPTLIQAFISVKKKK